MSDLRPFSMEPLSEKCFIKERVPRGLDNYISMVGKISTFPKISTKCVTTSEIDIFLCLMDIELFSTAAVYKTKICQLTLD